MSRLSRSSLPVLVLLAVVLAAPSSTAQTTPSITYTVTDKQGKVLTPRKTWYRQVGGVVVRWKVVPTPSSTTNCELAWEIPFQTAGTTLSCTAQWPGGWTITRETVPPIRIDWTRPTNVRVKPGRPPDAYGWYGRPIRFFSSGRDALSRIDVCPTKTYRRPNDGTASLTGFCRDRAGNVTKRTVNFKYRSPLISPRRGRTFRRPPLLDWIEVRNARFYNVQIWQNGKVLSRFRDASRFQVSRTWLQNGVRHRLQPGRRYHVYVWPRLAERYGKRSLYTWFAMR